MCCQVSLFWRFDWMFNPSPPKILVHTMRISHCVAYYFSWFFQPVLVFSSQHFGHFLAISTSLPQIFLPTFRLIILLTGFPVIQTVIPLLPWFTSLPLLVFPLFGHSFNHLVCLPHTSLPTFTTIASFTGFPALQSILPLLPTFTFPPLAHQFN